MKFTDAEIEKELNRIDEPKRVADDKEDGLAIRFHISPSGKRSATWIWARERKAADGRRIRFYEKIGRFQRGVNGVREARLRARDLNIDYIKDEMTGEASTPGAPTVEDQATVYFAREVEPRLRPRTAEGYRRWRDLFNAEIGFKKITKVTVEDVERMRDVITQSSGPRAANGAVGLFGQIYRDWAARAKNATPDPTSAVRRNKIERRKFELIPDEVATFFRVAEADEDRDLWMFLAFTGCRRSEALNATRDQFDLDRRCWVIPAEGSKNKQATTKPLVDEVIEIVRRRGDGTLFPSKRGRIRKGIKREWSRLREAAEGVLDHWTPHSLRKLNATVGRSAGLSREQLADILGHVDLESQDAYAFGTDADNQDAATTIAGGLKKLKK